MPKILGIKVRHYVPLPAFEKAIEEMQRLGAGLPVSLQRYPDYGLAICTFGSLDVVGCDTDLSAEPRGAVVLVRVRGLQELAPPGRGRRQRAERTRDLARGLDHARAPPWRQPGGLC